MELVFDKITVPSKLPRVSRRRLLEKLHESLSRYAASIINGRAGTGKSLLATDFAWDSGRRVAWYKVDASDIRLQDFLQYLVESISRQRHGFYTQALDQLARTVALEDVHLLAELFVYELQECGGAPLLIIIDDLHLVYDATWVVPFFGRLLPLLPEDVHMLITCRSLLPAPLWRMRSKQTLCLIEESELAFTDEEGKDLLSSYNVSEEEACMGLAQSRGRAATLDEFAFRLCASSKEDGFRRCPELEVDAQTPG